MSKDRLLSDEELEERLLARLRLLVFTEHEDKEGWVASTSSLFMNLINTQKRLYAESVIGEDEAEPYYIRRQIEVNARNKLRASQRERNK